MQYLPEGPEVSGSCGSTSLFNSLAVRDLDLELLDASGTVIVAISSTAPAGSNEMASLVSPPGGATYRIRVTGDTVNDIQLYRLRVVPNSSYCAAGAHSTIWGDQSNAGFASSVANAGDVNNDGVPDVIVGSYARDSNGIDAGTATVYSGSNGSPIWTWHGENPNDWFGYAVAGAGDANSDGYADVVVGAPKWDSSTGYPPTSFDRGKIYVFSGIDGSILRTVTGPSGFGPNHYGWSVDGVGDVDGDGFDDVVVGRPDGSGCSPLCPVGSVFVVSVQTGGNIHSWTSSGPDKLGYSVAGLGDVNGDGYPDYAGGAIDPGGTGYVRVFSGLTGQSLYTVAGDSTGDEFGVSVRSAGDVDADGHADLIVGARKDDNTGLDAGSATVYSGFTGMALFQVNGSNGSDWFGDSVGSAGDVDGDGFDDFLVGAPNESGFTGSAYIFSGMNASLLSSFLGDSPNDFLGESVSGAGDINGDGFADVIVGIPGSDLQGPNYGAAKLFTGTMVVPLLSISQPTGSGSLQIENLCMQAGDLYFTALSTSAANSGPTSGTGWWGGLHIGLGELVTQYLFAAPPFRGTLDPAGHSSFMLPAGALQGIIGTTFYAVTRTFDQTTSMLTATSNLASVTIQ